MIHLKTFDYTCALGRLGNNNGRAQLFLTNSWELLFVVLLLDGLNYFRQTVYCSQVNNRASETSTSDSGAVSSVSTTQLTKGIAAWSRRIVVLSGRDSRLVHQFTKFFEVLFRITIKVASKGNGLKHSQRIRVNVSASFVETKLFVAHWEAAQVLGSELFQRESYSLSCLLCGELLLF
ncbi:hypothetical protein CLUG_02296 [Clavispora lusitaniae ATCC 42720]|uniref:Uncharacterized protein n=1 Tax=Clavispora lusitaniae (strain ATCC 42720) TaxID=306902 RepID=C4Y264_CLAL4|nr:uncharacterized protein CLUG_02296 [Clavispora lusitaniae ATCC 42720]EEQ38173.1 hypothetical protein CLUG_02296 [Clavispora lusitaniae ATCC 42720]